MLQPSFAVQRLLVVLLAALVCHGCASPPGDARVTLRNFNADDTLELTLVSRSWVERTAPESVAPTQVQLEDGSFELDLATEADYYSQKRDSAAAKVMSDEGMSQLLRDLKSEGFDKRATDGRGPERADQGYHRSIEVETAEGTRHYSLNSSADGSRLTELRDLALVFSEAYNGIFALQSVDPRPVDEVFQQPEIPERLRK